ARRDPGTPRRPCRMPVTSRDGSRPQRGWHRAGHDGGGGGPMPSTYVVVSGPPGSGKTTLARQIAPALGLPLLAKDTIKQALMTVLPVPDVETSRLVGRASVTALLAVAAENAGAVLESVWHRSYAVTDRGRRRGSMVEVFCRCD